MSSPFPGMDPYLEGELWQEFNDSLANQISEQLLSRLPPRYVALLSKRYILDRPVLSVLELPSERILYPDVHIAELHDRAAMAYAPASAGTAEPPLELISPIPEQVPLLSVEIRDVAERRLVTVIEILSPVNKRGQGLRDAERVDRRMELLQTRTHLLEIDLLRAGTRIPLIGDLPPPRTLFTSAAHSGGPARRYGRFNCERNCPPCPCRCCRLIPTCHWNCRQQSRPVSTSFTMSGCWTMPPRFPRRP